MSLKYCPACGKIEESSTSKLLIWSIAFAVLACIVIAVRYEFYSYLPLRKITREVLELTSVVLWLVGIGYACFAIWLELKNRNKACECLTRYISVPNYNLISTLVIWAGLFFIYQGRDELYINLSGIVILVAGILIFVLSPLAKVATLLLYRVLYPVKNMR